MLTAGIDVGTTAMKIVIVDDSCAICKNTFNYTKSGVSQLVKESLCKMLVKLNFDLDDIDFAISTGLKVNHSSIVDTHIIEPIAHTRWAKTFYPDAKLIVDIGHIKTIVTKCNNGNVINSFASDKCASGAGIFLQTVCDALEINIKSINDGSYDLKNSITVENTCSVFAESEIISLLYQGIKPEKILMGAVKGLASRVYPMMLKAGALKDVVFVGGYSKIEPLILAIEKLLRAKITIADSPLYTAAHGAAILARDKINKG